MSKLIFFFSLLAFSNFSIATGNGSASNKNYEDESSAEATQKSLNNFGFGPAFFAIAYNEEVLSDSKDVRTRGDGSIEASGSKFANAIGLEVHYAFSFGGRRYRDPDDKTKFRDSYGFLASPFFGMYDLDDGINGFVVGAMVGLWRGDGKYQNRNALNFGVGYTVHKDRLVLGRGISEGDVPAVGLTDQDYTERKDVEGIAYMITAELGF